MSLLATLSMAGCLCTPTYHPGMQQSSYGRSTVVCDSGCDPCGAIESPCAAPCSSPCSSPCSVVEYGGGGFCVPPKVVDCRNSISNVSNGICLIGRGLLDVTAAPFILVGNALSSGCRYEVLAHCDNVYYGKCYPVQETVSPCDPTCSSGCDTCANGYSDGIQFNQFGQYSMSANRVSLLPPRISNSVIQASYQEPTAPALRFVQPK
jgi:hypothetical protein